MALNETLSLMLIEANETEDWEYDHNTTVLLILQSNLASLLRACLVVSDNLNEVNNIDVTGLINGITETLSWLVDSTEKVKKDG